MFDLDGKIKVLLILISGIVFIVLIHKFSTNSVPVQKATTEDKIEIEAFSSLPNYQLEFSNLDLLKETLRERKFASNGILDMKGNEVQYPSKIVINLSDREIEGLGSVKNDIGGKLATSASANYQIDGKKLTVNVYLAENEYGLQNEATRDINFNLMFLRQIYILTSHSETRNINIAEIDKKIIELIKSGVVLPIHIKKL